MKKIILLNIVLVLFSAWNELHGVSHSATSGPISYISPPGPQVLDKVNNIPGTIGGAIDVSPTGAATYTIPVRISPGSNGMQPDLNIVYSSQAGFGLLGHGWTIAGLSAITRANKIPYFDGNYKGVNLTPDDGLALDGVRLINTTGNIFSPANNPYSEVEYNGTGYVLTTQDGLKIYYGYTSDSRFMAPNSSVPYAWAINKIVDPNGNYIDYVYFKDVVTGENRISEINYTGNILNNLLPYNSIKFYYKTRKDEGFAYIAGKKLSNNAALHCIKVFSEGVVSKEYQFYYTYDLYTKLSKIALIDEGESVNPTLINWNTVNYNLSVVDTDYGTTDSIIIYQGDVNGDGLTDIIRMNKTKNQAEIRILNINGSWISKRIKLPSAYSGYTGEATINYNFEIKKINLFDWTGNGVDEVIIDYLEHIEEITEYIDETSGAVYHFYNNLSNHIISTYTYNQENFVLIDSISFGNSQSINYQFYYADLNNDGIINRLRVVNGILIGIERLNPGTLPSITGIHHIDFGDFDGNGLIDLVVMPSTGSGSSLWEFNNDLLTRKNFPSISFSVDGDPKSFMAGDFNGDGKTDYIVFNNRSGWKLYYSTGNSFVNGALPFKVNYTLNPVVTWLCEGRACDRVIEMQYTLDPKLLRISDINNDGKSDLIFARHDSLYISFSNGGNFTFEDGTIELRTPVKIGITSIEIFHGKNNGEKSLLVGSSLTVGKLYKLIHFQNRLDKNLLVDRITDGMNNQTLINYSVYHDNRPYSPSFPKPAFPLLLLRGPFLLTGSVETSFNGELTNTTNFAYEDGYFHIGGLGFLGFKKFISDNITSGIKTTGQFQFTLQSGTVQYYNTWLSSQEVRRDNILLSSVTNTFQALGGNLSKKLFIPVAVTVQQTDHIKNISSTNNNSFNSTIGRITASSTNTGTGAWTMSTNISYTTVEGFVTKPVSIAQVKTLNGSSFSQHKLFEYDISKPLRLTAKVQQGVKTTFNSFDQYGNIKSITTDATGEPLTSTVAYDEKGRYAISNTDPLGMIETYAYRHSDGRLASKTDPNGFTALFNYSLQGGSKITTTTLPDGITLTKTLGWDQTGTGLFFVKEQSGAGGYNTSIFNSAGQKLKEIYPGFQNVALNTTYSFNPDGSIKSKQTTGFETVNYFYKNDGRLERTTGKNLDITLSYNGNSVTTTDNNSGIVKSDNFDEIGNLITVGGTMGNISYQYNPAGLVSKIISNGVETEMFYDNRGNQTQLKDPSAGTTNYTYNNRNQLLTQTDAKGQTMSMQYAIGRLIGQTGPGITITYSYYDSPGKKGLLQSVSRNGIVETYYYGAYNRLDSTRVQGSGKTFTTAYQYNSQTQIYRVSFPSDLTLQYEYDNPGNVTKIYDVNNLSKPLWEGVEKNERQQWTQFNLGNDLITKYNYDSNYLLSSIMTGTSGAPNVVQNLGFTFNNKGQLTGRFEGNKHEEFEYDIQNRLKKSAVFGHEPVEVFYNNIGNITSSSLAGSFTYKTNKPFAVEAVSGVTGQGQAPTLFTYSTFTADNKVAVMDNGVFRNEFTYCPSGNRFKVDHYGNNTHLYSKMYVDNNEFVLDNAGNIKLKRTFIHAPTGTCAVYQDSAGVKKFHYVHTDYLGSWLTVTNENRQVVTRNSYDAWGRPRNPNTWELFAIGIDSALVNLNAMQPRFDRGYTGHEHMCGFGLINMNGRLYDPYLQRFLSPDPYVQSPMNAQNFNRYTYCLNNPLMYTDPTGYYHGGESDREAARISFNNWWNNWISQFDNPNGTGGSGNLTYNWGNSTYYLGNTPIPTFSAMSMISSMAYSIPTADINSLWNAIQLAWARLDGIPIIWMVHTSNLNLAWAVTSFGAQYAQINFSLSDNPQKLTIDYWIKNAQSGGGSPYPFISGAFTAGEEMMFSKNFNTWMGKDFKIRSQNWGGNRAAGGKFKFAQSTSKGIGLAGKFLGFWGLYNTYQDGRQGVTTPLQTSANAISNLVGIFGGLYGASWSFGWEMGKNYGPSKWFTPKPQESIILEYLKTNKIDY